MKKIRNLVLIVLAVMSAVCIFSTSKACAYSVKQDNVVATLKDTGRGVVAILKNKNRYAVNVDATLVFKNGGKMIGSNQDYNYCLEAGKECALFFPAPMDRNYNYKKYNNYKISLDVDKTSADFYAVNKIKVSADSDSSSVTVEVKNKSKKKLEYLNLSIIYYDKNKNAIGWDEWIVYAEEVGSENYVTFDYPDGITPDSYKIYVNHAFSIDWGF